MVLGRHLNAFLGTHSHHTTMFFKKKKKPTTTKETPGPLFMNAFKYVFKP